MNPSIPVDGPTSQPTNQPNGCLFAHQPGRPVRAACQPFLFACPFAVCPLACLPASFPCRWCVWGSARRCSRNDPTSQSDVTLIGPYDEGSIFALQRRLASASRVSKDSSTLRSNVSPFGACCSRFLSDRNSIRDQTNRKDSRCCR